MAFRSVRHVREPDKAEMMKDADCLWVNIWLQPSLPVDSFGKLITAIPIPCPHNLYVLHKVNGTLAAKFNDLIKICLFCNVK